MSFENEKEIVAFLVLNRLGPEGRRRTMLRLGEGKSSQEIWEEFCAEDLFNDTRFRDGKETFLPEKEIEICAAKGIDLLTVQDEEYPKPLKQIPDPPLVLYKKGTLEATDRNSIAIVGTRHPSFYGRTQAKRFSRALAEKGLTVVSGLARGIDQAAHEAALEVFYGRTIAVLGSGLDVIYPRENERLFEEIIGHGAVFSEYPLGTPPLPENFPRRNRILSGLSCGVLVVEAHSRSGSLITAGLAVEQGREVFAIPGPVDQLTSRGTNQILKEGACLAEDPEDILEVLAGFLQRENGLELPSKTTRNAVLLEKSSPCPQEMIPEEILPDDKTVPLGEAAETVARLLREEGPLNQDEILEICGLEPARLPSLLLQLELARRIKKANDGRYALFAK